MSERLSVRQRCRQIRELTDDAFFGWYRGFQIEVNREPDDLGFYIMVSGERGYLYDGWWSEGVGRSIEDAFYEALRGAQLLPPPPSSTEGKRV